MVYIVKFVAELRAKLVGAIVHVRDAAGELRQR